MGANRIFGLLLIALGGTLLLIMSTDIGGEAIPAAVGVCFLTAYAFTRNYGFLVPGAILAGLGGGLIAASQGAPDGSATLGLGIGFLVIGVVDRLLGEVGSGWWWPFIPGGILVATSAADMTGFDDLPAYLAPVALIVVGVLLLLRRGDSQRGRRVVITTQQPRPDHDRDRTDRTDRTDRPNASS